MNFPHDNIPPITRAHILSLIVLLLLAAGLRAYRLDNLPLWLDEQCQLSVAQAPTLSEAVSRATALGPIGRLSYFDSWIAWHLGATTRFLFRLPAVMWGVLAVALTFELGRRWFSADAGLLAAALLSVHGVHIQFSREARGYALTVVLVLVWALQATRMLRSFKWWDGVLFFVLSLVTVELHPVTLVPLGLIIMVLLVNSLFVAPSQRKVVFVEAALATLAVALVFLSRRDMPLLYSNLTELPHSLSWYLIDIYKALVGGYWGVSSYAIFGVVACGIVCGLRTPSTRLQTALLCAVACAAAAPVISGWSRGMYVVPRYSLFSVPFFMLAAGYGIERIRPQKLLSAAALAPILSVVLLLGMWLQNRSPYDLEHDKIPNPNWPSLEK